jgi:hypothetical protein
MTNVPVELTAQVEVDSRAFCRHFRARGKLGFQPWPRLDTGFRRYDGWSLGLTREFQILLRKVITKCEVKHVDKN